MAMFNYPPSASNLAKACDRVLWSPAPPAAAAAGASTTDVAVGTSTSSTAANATVGAPLDAPLDGFKRLLAALRGFNGTCFDLDKQAPGAVPMGRGFAGSAGSVACSDWSGCGPSVAWDYQACTQVQSINRRYCS
jgi:hypothetical protein